MSVVRCPWSVAKRQKSEVRNQRSEYTRHEAPVEEKNSRAGLRAGQRK